MFRKIFGNKSKKNRLKRKRLSPAHNEHVGNVDGGIALPPSYQYAMNEYALTGPQTNNVDDDGRIRPSYSMTETQQRETETHHAEDLKSSVTPPPPPPGEPSSNRDGILRSSLRRSQNQQHQQHTESVSCDSYHGRRILSPKADYFSYDEDDQTAATFGEVNDDGSIGGPSMLKQPSYIKTNSSNGKTYSDRGHLEPIMPDSTYEEWYGDAYIGGPIRYVYPSGYQSMRPRGGPWRLSIVVCLLFTWLSVFVIGYCANNGNSNNNNSNNDYSYAIDDDSFVIDAKWCGSRLLYLLWVISMLITGLATAYCSVIGYIKVRDFVVANTRSQPPGIMTVGDQLSSGVNGNDRHGHSTQGNSDYYVRIGDANNNCSVNSRFQHASGLRLQQTHPAHYNKTIYQADGTPQFWGNQIYRPTQAAVAITSR